MVARKYTKAGVDWEMLKTEFVLGSDTYRQIAERHGIKATAVSKRAQREKWSEARQKKSREVAETAVAQVTERRTNELVEFNEADLKIAKALRGMVARRINEAQQGHGKLTAVELRSLASTAAEAQRMGRLALGVSTDNHGHGGPNGEGPVPVTNVPLDVYLAARQQVLAEF